MHLYWVPQPVQVYTLDLSKAFLFGFNGFIRTRSLSYILYFLPMPEQKKAPYFLLIAGAVPVQFVRVHCIGVDCIALDCSVVQCSELQCS